MIGKKLAHFEILESLGSGGMGEVYLARDTKLERDIALKVLPAELADDPMRRNRFLNEARTVAALNHPNIVTIHSVEEDQGIYFITMELIRGVPLDEQIPEQGLPRDSFFEIVLPLIDAVAAAHECNVVHRDLKPANVMLTEDGRLKVLDFGLATSVDVAPPEEDENLETLETQLRLTGENQILGTVPYMSPEQLQGTVVDQRSDLFSLGIMLYEMAVGQRPFHGDSGPALMSSILKDLPPPVTHLNPRLDGELGRIIGLCLEKYPERRIQSARELYEELSALHARGSDGPESSANPISDRPAPGISGPIEFAHDLFISYAQLDNEAQLAGQEGWVSAFHRSLEVRVGQLLGKRPNILRNPKLRGGDALDENEIREIPQSALLISVLSPRYIKSEWCTRELDEFIKASAQTGGPKWGAKYRMFKVVKTPTPPERHPPEIQPLLGYEFFKFDPESGRLRELDQIFGPEAQRDYWARLDDLAHDIVEVLEQAEAGSPDPQAGTDGFSSSTTAGVKGSIYVAPTSYDLKEEHDAVRRDLQRHGYRVLPDEPLPLVGSELEPFVTQQLEKCLMSIHLVGRNYGVVPEGSNSSIIELQCVLGSRRAAKGKFPQMIWIPADIQVADDRQQEVVNRLRTNPNLPPNTDLIETPLEDLKTVVHQVLRTCEPEEEAATEDPGSEVTRIYLICDQRDEDATAPLADLLFEKGFDVTLPIFEGDESEVREEHEENLRSCDGVLVYYGAGNELWLRRKLREVQKSAGLGRIKSMAAQGIWVAPPTTPQKMRLRTREAIVMTGDDAFTPDLLKPFIGALQGAA